MQTSDRALRLQVNGEAIETSVPSATTLAEVIRDHLGLSGTKVACDQAACGACTVILDGRAIFACHTLAAQCNAGTVQTIEGLANGETLHPLQAAFIEHDALQCGFCTPGMIMALKAAADSGVSADRKALAKAIAGNICRCGAYEHILDAALAAMAR